MCEATVMRAGTAAASPRDLRRDRMPVAAAHVADNRGYDLGSFEQVLKCRVCDLIVGQLRNNGSVRSGLGDGHDRTQRQLCVWRGPAIWCRVTRT